MNKMRKEDALKNYLGEDRIQNLADVWLLGYSGSKWRLFENSEYLVTL